MKEKIQLEKINCSNCGADLIYSPGTQMTNCNFCGSEFEIDNVTKIELILPDKIIPFKITKENYEKYVLEWLIEGDYTPNDILTSSVLGKVSGTYLPMYLYTGRCHGNWSASSGYDKIIKTSRWNGKRYESDYHTETDWRPSSGQFSDNFSILCFAGSNKGIDQRVIDYSEEVILSKDKLKEYNSKYTLGFNLLEFTQEEEGVWSVKGEGLARDRAGNEILNKIPGDRYDHLTADYFYDREEVIKFYTPYWITNYEYNGVSFFVCMDGIEKLRILGERPVDEGMKKEAEKYNWMLVFPISVGIFWISLIWLKEGWDDNLLFSPIFGVFWFVRLGFFLLVSILVLLKIDRQSSSIIDESKKIRKEILNNL